MEEILPLHLCHVSRSSLIINRSYIFLHGIALAALIYYRISSLSKLIKQGHELPFMICHLLVFLAELILSFLWLLTQSYRWRPVRRSAFPERLPEDENLPAIDVFVCTADPNKEPSVEVMNTVISAMALDYPPGKLNVYLSDDGGSSVTLKAMKEARKFASCWLPFCRKYGIRTRCPEAYFSGVGDSCRERISSVDFGDEKEAIQKRHELFKKNVKWIAKNTGTILSKDHPPRIEVIEDETYDTKQGKETEMPLLVYVSREKRPFHPHNFKAGALNTLLRVSGVMSNSPYILLLDCDMHCNDSSSARQAMCFHLDDKINSNLAVVQFPQKFRNMSAKDIYDSQLRFFMTIQYYGGDGIGGPMLAGTGCYIKREALYGANILQKGSDLEELQKFYGPSNEFIKSTHQRNPRIDEKFSTSIIKETEFLASCCYEQATEWGEQVGFRNSTIEDYCTGLKLASEGWKFVYLNPSIPAFLGSATTNLSDFLIQHTRWFTGLFRNAISKHSPLIYGPSKGQYSVLHRMFCTQLSFYSIIFLPLWCLSIIPQICLIHGVSLYPTVLDPFFIVFAFVFLSSNFKHAQEVLSDGLRIRSWIYEQRMWMIKSVTCYTYGSLNATLDKFGLAEASFFPTNKVSDDEQFQRYQSGIYDFQASMAFIAPMCTLVILNFASMLLGGFKIFFTGNYGEMFAQCFIALFVVVIQYPVIEGMLFRKDQGRITPSAALLSALLAVVILVLGSLISIV